MAALVECATGRSIVSGARGVGDATAHRSFLGSTLPRLREAVVDPPPRFQGQTSGSAEEYVGVAHLPRLAVGTGAVAAAVARVHRDWPGSPVGGKPLIIAGVSRRPQGVLTPDRRTGYVRFRIDPAWAPEYAAAVFRRLAPEPDFPETSVGGVAPRLVRVLRRRLGATAQVSNLGVVESAGLTSVTLFPALSGPSAVTIGVVSAASVTSVSLRTRRSEFSDEESADLLKRVADELEGSAGRVAQ
jgi:hypothetical protein